MSYALLWKTICRILPFPFCVPNSLLQDRDLKSGLHGSRVPWCAVSAWCCPTSAVPPLLSPTLLYESREEKGKTWQRNKQRWLAWDRALVHIVYLRGDPRNHGDSVTRKTGSQWRVWWWVGAWQWVDRQGSACWGPLRDCGTFPKIVPVKSKGAGLLIHQLASVGWGLLSTQGINSVVLWAALWGLSMLLQPEKALR